MTTPEEFYTELVIFRSQLIEIRSSNDNTRLKGILDKYQDFKAFTIDQFELFVEDYHIAGLDPKYVSHAVVSPSIEYYI